MRVLVVDDDAATQRHCRAMLEGEGFEVHCESSLGSTRRFLRTQDTDVILMDLFLPDGCGYELLHSSPELVADTPVVAMTGVYKGSAAARLLATRYDFQSVIGKPLTQADLCEALRAVFGTRYPGQGDWSGPPVEKTTLTPMHFPQRNTGQRASPLPYSAGAFVPSNTSNHLIAEEPLSESAATVHTAPDTWEAADRGVSGFQETFVSPLDPSRGVALHKEAMENAAGWDLSPSMVERTQILQPAEVAEEHEERTIQVPRRAMSEHLDPPSFAQDPSPSPRPSVLADTRLSRHRNHEPAPAHSPVSLSASAALAVLPRPEVSTSQPETPLQNHPPGAQGQVPTPFDPARVPLQGRLQRAPIASLLARLARARATGSLLLRKEQVKKIVYLERGVPRAVKSNLLYECLGRMLVREGQLREEDCEHSVERLKVEKRAQGEILIEMGAMAPEHLEHALARQFDEKLYDVFSWEEGLYRFRADELPKTLRRIAPREPFGLILAGIRRSTPVERMSRDLSALDALIPAPRLSLAEIRRFGLHEEEMVWLERLDGKRTLGSWLSMSGNDERAMRLIYGLLCIGVIATLES